MEVYTIEKTDKSVKIGLKDIDTTLIIPLLDELNKNSYVKLARRIDVHPELADTALYVEVYSGDPIQPIVDGLSSLSRYYNGEEEKVVVKPEPVVKVPGDPGDNGPAEDSEPVVKVPGDNGPAEDSENNDGQ